MIRSLSRFDETSPELLVELTSIGYVTRESQTFAREQIERSILIAVPTNPSESVTLADLCKAGSVKRTAGQEVVNKLISENKLIQL